MMEDSNTPPKPAKPAARKPQPPARNAEMPDKKDMPAAGRKMMKGKKKVNGGSY